MNLNPSAVVMFLVGTVLMYAAVGNKDPRDVIREALNKPPQHGPITGFGEREDPITPGTPITPITPIGVPVVTV